MKFIIATKDYSGLGFAKLLKDEGNEVLLAYKMSEDDQEKEQEYFLVGEGIVDKVELDEVFKQRAKFKDWMWIWDGNF